MKRNIIHYGLVPGISKLGGRILEKMGTPLPVKQMEKSKGGPGMMGQELSNDIQVVRFEAKVRGHTDEGLSYTSVKESQEV